LIVDLPTVRQLECLVAVAETLSFRAAAELCFVTQPAVSNQIRQLETSLGLKLFERDKRRVIPTAAGAVLAARAREILADLREFVGAAPAFKRPLCGKLVLGVIPTVAPYLLPRCLPCVRDRHPDLRLLLQERQTAHLVASLAEGSVDLALLALEAELDDLETLPLARDPFLLAVPEGHRLWDRAEVREADLADEPVLLLEDGHCLRDQVLPFCEQARACELGDFRASSLGTLIQMVSGGIGVTLIPGIAAAVEAGPDRGLRLIPFAPPAPARTLGLAWRRSSLREEEFRILGETLTQGLGATA
jgi:LysR family hydrogen peroxide-inducible transcriptional activator